MIRRKDLGVSGFKKTAKNSFTLYYRAIVLVLAVAILIMAMCPIDIFMEISEGNNEKLVVYSDLKDQKRMLSKEIIQLKDALDEKKAYLESLDERLEYLGYQYMRLLEKRRRIDSRIDSLKADKAMDE